MKKLLLILTICSTTSLAQCPSLQCVGHQMAVNGTMTNTTLTGNICWSGTGTISNSVTYNSWTKMTWSGNINHLQAVNFNNTCKAWISSGSNITLDYASFSQSDTLWVYGNLILNSWVSNNSFSNTIVLGQGATLKIAGTWYNSPPYTLNNVSNPTNVLKIISCGSTPLPTVLEYFTYPLSFSFLKVDDLYKVDILYSKDGNSFENLQSFYSCLPNIQYKSDFNYQGWYKLRMIDFRNQESYSQTLRVQGTIQSPSQAYDILGRKTTPKNLYIQNNKLNFKY